MAAAANLNIQDNFLGCKIEKLKYVTPSDGIQKIVVSTCYFLNSFLEVSPRIFNYLTSLVENIESFQYKMDIFTTARGKYQWTYRVYIDSIIWQLPSILAAKPVFTDVNLANSRLKQINQNFDKNKKILIFICSFIQEYIKFMIRDLQVNPDSKYRNIEIYTYENESALTKLKSDPLKFVAGHYDTFGTLLRFHPLIEVGNYVCIMRNCSDLLTPIDIVIQDFWINNKQDDYYMEYYSEKYKFEKISKNLRYFMQVLYKDIITTITSPLINYFKRSFAGLISCRMFPGINDTFTERFNKLKGKLVNSNINNRNNSMLKYNTNTNTKYLFGIDEISIPMIIPEFGIYGIQQELKYDNFALGKKPNYTSPLNTYRISSDYENDVFAPGLHPLQNVLQKINCHTDFNFLRHIIFNKNSILPDKYSDIYGVLSKNMFAVNSLPIKFHGLIYLLKSIEWRKKPFFVFSYTSDEDDGKKITTNDTFITLLDGCMGPDKVRNNEFFFYNFLDLDSIDVNQGIQYLLRTIITQYTPDNFSPLLFIPEKLKINYQDDTEDEKQILLRLSTINQQLSSGTLTGGNVRKLYKCKVYKYKDTFKKARKTNKNGKYKMTKTKN